MRYWYFLVIVILFCSCNRQNISTLKHEKLRFKDLPSEIINCIRNPNDFQEERNNMLIELPKGANPEYKVENVKTWTGPWVSYVKLVDIRTNVYYKIDQGVPNPYFIFKNKLYIPDRYNIFTTVEDYSTLEFTCYTLRNK
ncbi:hypothetical protein EYV94_22800 [Puteibacter caeruleilacunae]|nr:hypothetical protein EYV94_22800 [Puteibacter caeruleilacunae]